MDQVLELIRSELDSGQCLEFWAEERTKYAQCGDSFGFPTPELRDERPLEAQRGISRGPRDDRYLQAGRLLLPDNSLPPVKPDGVRLKRTIHCEAKADITSARIGYGTRYTSTQPGI